MLVMKGITATFALIYCSLGKWGKRGTLGPKELSPQTQTHPKSGQQMFHPHVGHQWTIMKIVNSKPSKASEPSKNSEAIKGGKGINGGPTYDIEKLWTILPDYYLSCLYPSLEGNVESLTDIQTHTPFHFTGVNSIVEVHYRNKPGSTDLFSIKPNKKFQLCK